MWLLLADPNTKFSNIDVHSLARVLIATAAMALTNFFYKIGLQHGALPETMVSTQAWVFTSLATILRLQQEGFHITPSAWRYSTSAALVLGAGFILLLHGLALGPASVLVPVAQMSFVLTAVIGAALFHESLDWRKRGGLVVVVIARALFAIS